MSLLEAKVNAVRTLLSTVPSVQLEIDSAVGASKNAHAGLILKTDTAVELGAPETASAALSLYSNRDGADEVRLIGRPLIELSQKSVSFAEIVILKGDAVDAEMFYQFSVRRHRLEDFPGWMVKSAAGKEWVRCAPIDGKAPAFEIAAATLIARTHEAFPKVCGVEVWYVTENTALVNQLYSEAQSLLEATRSLKEGVWKARGFDYQSCQLAGHCGGCADKKTCASVRTMQARVRINRRRTEQNNGETPT